MAAKYPEESGVALTTNSTGGALSAGDVIVCGDSIRILAEDLANGASGIAFTAGKFSGTNALTANSALTWNDGAALYYDASNAYLTNSAVGTTYGGLAFGAKSAGAATAGLLLGAASGALANNGVVTAKIANDAVTAAKTAYYMGAGTTSAADSLAIPITHEYVAKTTGADGESLTLANGTAGQKIIISLVVDGGGDGTLVPTTKTGYTSIVFADAGDTVALYYVDDTIGWVILGAAGVSAPPVISIS